MNCNLKGVSKTRQAFLRKLVSYCPFQSYLKERPDSSTVDMYIPNEKSLRLEVYTDHKTRLCLYGFYQDILDLMIGRKVHAHTVHELNPV